MATSTDIIDPTDLILTFEDVDGWKAVSLFSGELRICDPCWRWSEVARRASWTGGYDADFEPNLCRAHRKRYLRGSGWDGPLQDGTGRPRENVECALVGCDEPGFSRGLCKVHYQKDYRAKKRAQKERA